MNAKYISYPEVTKEVLDTIKVGDLIKVNGWQKPMRVKGVSENYAVMIQKNFEGTHYSVIAKKPRAAGQHNAMRQGCFHCGKDDYIFGAAEFQYRFDDAEAVAKYLDEFETGETHLSERSAIPILTIHIKSNSK